MHLSGLQIALLLPLLLLAAGCLAYWIAVMVEIRWMIRNLPTARDGINLPPLDNPPTVCLIIPAHNEARSIATVAFSLVKQDYPNLRVVFALDRCTDNTRAVLEGVVLGDRRFSIYTIDSCPADWAGKVNAVWQAVSNAPAAQNADILCFADADTEFDPACIRSCVALMRKHNYGLLSLMSTLTCEHWFEKVVQPVAGYELMRQFPPRRVNRDEKRRAVANGQFMMFTKDCYWSFGGHANPLVKDELLEDIAVAKRARWYGYKAGFLAAAGMLHCKMYDSYRDFELGWRRIYAELAHRRPRRLRSYALQLLLTDITMPIASAASIVVGALIWSASNGFSPPPAPMDSHEIPPVDWVTASTAVGLISLGSAALLIMLTVLLTGCRWGRAPMYLPLLHVPGAILVLRILLAAARDLEARRPVRWGGRTYVREPRYEGDEGFWRSLLGRRRDAATEAQRH